MSDIPWWVGLIGLLLIIYSTSSLPSEWRPLPIVTTVPAAGERDVALDTEIEVRFEPGGLAQTLPAHLPTVALTYDDVASGPPLRAIVDSMADDVLRAHLDAPLKPGHRVAVAVETRYGQRSIVWKFYTTSALPRAVK